MYVDMLTNEESDIAMSYLKYFIEICIGLNMFKYLTNIVLEYFHPSFIISIIVV